MSLVNDMLKDLDEQQKQEDQRLAIEPMTSDKASNDNKTGFDDNLGKNDSGKGKTISVFVALAIFILVLCGYYYKQSQIVPLALPVKPNVDDVLLTSIAPIEPTQGLMDHQQGAIDRSITTNNTNSASIISQTDSASEVLSVRINKKNQVIELVDIPEQPVVAKNIDVHVTQLLTAANAALKADRLTTPKNDNAHDRYRAILALKPNHIEAQKGLAVLQGRYLSFIKSVILKKQYYKVPDLVYRAREVGVNQKEIDQLLASLPEATSRPAKDVIKKIDQDNAPQKNSLVAFESAQVDTNNLTKSFSSLDSDVASAAAEDIKDKRYLQAENRLTEFVNENDKSFYALQKLFDLYVSQQRLSEAEKVIEKAAHFPGEWFSYMVAQVLTRRSDYEGAMRALSSHSPEIFDMPNFYALKAGLLHKLNQDDKAVSLYRQLLSLDNRNTSYWLGLSVALDTLNSDEALSAYKNTLKVAPKNAAYIDYIRRRISELTPPPQGTTR